MPLFLSKFILAFFTVFSSYLCIEADLLSRIISQTLVILDHILVVFDSLVFFPRLPSPHTHAPKIYLLTTPPPKCNSHTPLPHIELITLTYIIASFM